MVGLELGPGGRGTGLAGPSSLPSERSTRPRGHSASPGQTAVGACAVLPLGSAGPALGRAEFHTETLGTEPASTPSTPSPRPRAGAFPRSRGLREPHPISSSSPVRSTSQQHGRSSRARSHLVPRDPTALGWLPRGSLRSPHSLPPRPTQVDLPHRAIPEASSKKFEDALSLIHSAWQRSDSLCRGRASRDPWC